MSQRNKKSKIESLLKLKKDYLIPCVFHFFKNPPVIVKGRGAYVYDDTGKKYLDGYSGVGVVNSGHCNPSIVKAARKQLETLQHSTTIYITEPILKLAEKLAKFLPEKLKRSFFCATGTEANEGAMLLAKLHTGRTDFIAMSEAIHGRTYLTSSATGLKFWRTDPNPAKNIHFVPSPICSRCPLGLKYATCQIKCAYEAEKIIKKHPGKVAAFITESVHGNGGIHVPPKEYFKILKSILKKHGILLIFDEAQSGFCRTGKRFGFENFGVEPDILMVCKALGNGLPISAFVTTDTIAKSYTKPGASTFGGNHTPVAAAIATLEFIKKEKLEKNAKLRGAELKKGFKALQKKYSIISEVRGLGLMLGLELRRKKDEPAASELDFILETLKDNGLLAGKTGKDRNVLAFMPPLIITEKHVKFILKQVNKAFLSLSQI